MKRLLRYALLALKIAAVFGLVVPFCYVLNIFMRAWEAARFIDPESWDLQESIQNDWKKAMRKWSSIKESGNV